MRGIRSWESMKKQKPERKSKDSGVIFREQEGESTNPKGKRAKDALFYAEPWKPHYIQF